VSSYSSCSGLIEYSLYHIRFFKHILFLHKTTIRTLVRRQDYDDIKEFLTFLQDNSYPAPGEHDLFRINYNRLKKNDPNFLQVIEDNRKHMTPFFR